MSDDLRAQTFQLNIAGLTLLLFASSYIGRHLAVLMPVSGIAQLLVHYLGELVLTAVAVGFALWRAYRATRHGRAGWLTQRAVWLYVGLGAVTLNLVLMAVLLLLGRLG